MRSSGRIFVRRFGEIFGKQPVTAIKKRFGMVLLTAVLVLTFLPVASANAASAQEQLKSSIDQILEILRDPSLKGEDSAEKRRASLRKLVKERFSFAKMSQLSLATHWKDINDAEKQNFIELFGQLLEDTYLSKIESYTDEEVLYVKEYVEKDKAQVSTKIITNSIEIPMDYRMFQIKDGTWMIYDVVIEGVSLIRNYRSQFDQFLQKESYEKLLEKLENKLDPPEVKEIPPPNPGRP